MSTAQAIHKLRKKFGLKQPELARMLGVTPTSISRYENGKEPTTAVLTRLISLLSNTVKLGPPDAELKALHDLFEAKRRSDIVSQLVASPGTGRRIPLADLRLFRSGLNVLAAGLPHLLVPSEADAEKKQQITHKLLDITRQLLEVVTPYLTFGPEADLAEMKEWPALDGFINEVVTKWTTTVPASSRPVQAKKKAS